MVGTSLGTVGWDTLGTWWEHQNPPKSFPSSPLSQKENLEQDLDRYPSVCSCAKRKCGGFVVE